MDILKSGVKVANLYKKEVFNGGVLLLGILLLVYGLNGKNEYNDELENRFKPLIQKGGVTTPLLEKGDTED